MTFNTRNPAVKRLMREAKELAQPTELYYAQPLNDDLFEWHFTIRGPDGSDFAGGIYHGRISLPTEYPMKPPNITFLTPNGRFELFRELCLSISGYHPETWRPSWSIRTALLAIIGFMPTSGAGAIGSLDLPPEKRRELSVSSLNYSCDVCGATKDLVLPLTDASANISKEATEVAFQFNIIDQSAQKNASDKETAQDGNTFPPSHVSQANAANSSFLSNSSFEARSPSICSDFKFRSTTTLEKGVKANFPVSTPQPKYWICHPVYSNPEITSEKCPLAIPQSISSVTPSSPLSFEEWLKKRPSSTSAVQNPKAEESFHFDEIVPAQYTNSNHPAEVLNSSSSCDQYEFVDSQNNINVNNNEECRATKENFDSSPEEKNFVKENTIIATLNGKSEGNATHHEVINDLYSGVHPKMIIEPSSSTINQPDPESVEASDEVIIKTAMGTMMHPNRVSDPSNGFEVEITTSNPHGTSPSPETRRRFAVSVTKTTSIKKVQSPKEVAQNILREAAARHQRAISASDFNNEESTLTNVRKAQMAAFVFSFLLIVLVCRRLALIVL